jgi:hypothetical protein
MVRRLFLHGIREEGDRGQIDDLVLCGKPNTCPCSQAVHLSVHALEAAVAINVGQGFQQPRLARSPVFIINEGNIGE